MKRQYTFILTLIMGMQVCFGQRTTHGPSSTYTVQVPDTSTGRYFHVLIANNDSLPLLLKLGPALQIANNDTVNLDRTVPCSNPSLTYYDLEEISDLSDNCMGWYTLQLVNPGSALRFVIKLRHFDMVDSSRFYCCYTREIKESDRLGILNASPKKIFIIREARDFENRIVTLYRNDLNDLISIDLCKRPGNYGKTMTTH